jgi:hypothetical protein
VIDVFYVNNRKKERIKYGFDCLFGQNGVAGARQVILHHPAEKTTNCSNITFVFIVLGEVKT